MLAHEGGYSAVYAPFCGLAVIEELAGKKGYVCMYVCMLVDVCVCVCMCVCFVAPL